jgi:hypothetical protein
MRGNLPRRRGRAIACSATDPSLCQNGADTLASALLISDRRVAHVPLAGKPLPKTMHGVKTRVEPD